MSVPATSSPPHEPERHPDGAVTHCSCREVFDVDAELALTESGGSTLVFRSWKTEKAC